MSLQFLDFPGQPAAAAQDLHSVTGTAPGFGTTTHFINLINDSTAMLISDPVFPVQLQLLAGGLISVVPGVKNTVYSGGNIGYTDLVTGFGNNVTFETPTAARTVLIPDTTGTLLASGAQAASIDNTVSDTISIKINGTIYYLLARQTP